MSETSEVETAVNTVVNAGSKLPHALAPPPGSREDKLWCSAGFLQVSCVPGCPQIQYLSDLEPIIIIFLPLPPSTVCVTSAGSLASA